MQSLKKRVIEEADYIIKTNKTIREIACFFTRSKTTVHKDLCERLIKINYHKYQQVRQIFDNHISVRHINGGESTRKKFLKEVK